MIKARGKTQYKDVPVFEVTADKFIEDFRKVISGEIQSPNISEKTIRFLKVFLKEHGIDPDNW